MAERTIPLNAQALYERVQELEAQIADLQRAARQEEAQVRLKASEALFRTLFEEAAIGISLKDLDGYYMRVNPAFLNMLGYSECALVGKHFKDFTHPEDLGASLDNLAQLLAGRQQTYQIEKRYIHAEKHIVWVRLTVSMHRLDGVPAFVVAMVEDITEYKQAEERLQFDEALLRQTAEIAHVGGWELDLQGMKLIWSQEVCRIHEVPPDFAPDLASAIAFYHPDDLARIQRDVQRCIDEGIPFDGEYRVITNTGRHIWVRAKGEAIRANGRIVKLRGIFQDITSSYEHQEKLYLLESAITTANDAVLITDASIRTVFVNPALERMTGYASEEVLGKKPRLLQGPDTDDITIARIRDALQKKQPIREEILNYTKSGAPYWNELQIAPVGAKGEKVTHFVSVQRDITERKQIEEELRRLSTRLELAVRSADIGIWDLDVMHNTLIWDERMYALYGVEPKDFSSAYEAWRQGVHPEDRLQALEDVRLALINKKPLDTEFRVVWPNGSIRTIKAYAMVQHDSQGQAIRLVGINYDVTEHKQKEKELLQAKEEAEAMNRLKSVFLSNMSHELRTPLVGIMGFAEILQAEATAEQKEFAGYIISSGRRLLEIFNALLELSELESNQVTMQAEPCDIGEVIYQSLLLFDAIGKEKGLRFKINAEQRAVVVQADKRILRRILKHLLSNAVKFTLQGEVRVTVRKVGEVARLEIEDTGVGMEASFLQHMYDPFVQESSGDARVFDGGGIGLTLAKRYVEMLGGSIHISSIKGKGTKVSCQFPLSIHV